MNTFNYVSGTLVVALTALCGVFYFSAPHQENFEFKLDSEYHVVWLENGQTYIGKLEGDLNQAYVVLKDVHYVQNQMDEESKKADMVLVKREKKEIWQPYYMVISCKRILYIEPVTPTSTIAKSIINLK